MHQLRPEHRLRGLKADTSSRVAGKDIRVDVLLNSPGPHDQVRIRDPYQGLQRLGLDCRIHERPFVFSQCIRQDSIVVWQRPLPESRSRMLEHLQWLRQRGCLLLIDWDDHPDLFPQSVRSALASMEMAPLRYCHGILTSSAWLASCLGQYNPLVISVDNGFNQIPMLNLNKQLRDCSGEKPLRVMVGNLNRGSEHHQILPALLQWLHEDPYVQIVVVADQQLINALPWKRVEAHDLLPYASFRRLLQSCELALLPLANNEANRCKTVIKWQECAAESVAVVGGPALYSKTLAAHAGVWVTQLSEIVPAARHLANNAVQRCQIVCAAQKELRRNWVLQDSAPWHLWLLGHLWGRRKPIDAFTSRRLGLETSQP